MEIKNMLVLYNFEKAFNEIKGLPVEGNKKEYREFLESIKPLLGPNRHIDSSEHPVLFEIIDDEKRYSYIWYYYPEDYCFTQRELQSHKDEYDEEFDFTELFEDLVGAI